MLTIVFRAISISIFSYLVYNIVLNLNPVVFNPTAILNLLWGITSIISYGILWISNAFTLVFIYIIAMFSGVNLSSYYQNLAIIFNKFIYTKLFNFPETIVDIFSLETYAYHFGIQILILISMLSFLLYFKSFHVKFSIASIATLSGTVFLASVFGDINLGSYMAVTSFIDVFQIPAFQISLISYIYVELSLYFNYILEFSGEENKLVEHLEIKKEKLKEIEGRKLSLETLKKMDLYDYLRETLEEKAAGISKEELEKAKTLRKLTAYLDRLKLEFPEAEEVILGRKLKKSTKTVLKSSLLELFLRILVVTMLTVVCINPALVLNILNAPLPIVQSVELNMPESTIIFVLPLALVFPLVALIIDYMKVKGRRA